MRWLWAIVVVGCGAKTEPVVEQGSATPDAAVVPDKPDAALRSGRPDRDRTEHAVFSLVDNRHAAHRYYAGDLVIDGGDVGFAKYTRFSSRWKVGPIGGKRAAQPERQAILEAPLDGAMAAQVDRIELRVFAKAKQRLAVRINGRPIGKDAKSSRVELADGWQDISLPIDSGRLGSGENQVMVETTGDKQRVGIEWLRFASKSKQIVGDPRRTATFEPTTITLARDATLLWYVTLPEGAQLAATVKPGCKLDVRATTSDDSFTGGAITADSPRVDLTKLAGRVVGLTVTAQDCAKAVISDASIYVRGPAPTDLAIEPPKYVVLWVMDALRADKLAVFTPGARASTPNLDELAKSSAVFRQYYVQGNESQVSHASMFTGLYPANHGIKLEGNAMSKLSTKHDVLAQLLATAGYNTIAVTGNGYVNAQLGYARGFKEFRNLMREARGAGLAPNGEGVIFGKTLVDLAMSRLDASRDRSTFLFLGTIDNHSPWIARKPWIDQYSPNYKGPFQEYPTPEALGFKPSSMGCSVIPPDPEIERLRAIYDSAISYQDQLLGGVIEKLKSWGIWDQTMFIITSDHGDEFFEDGRCGHGGSLRESLVRVPLLIHYPARFRGEVFEEGAEAVDLVPTIIGAAKGPIPSATQGEGLLGRARGFDRDWVRPSYASQYEYAHAMRIGRWKIVVERAGLPAIYDLVAEPAEHTNVAAKHPVERRMLTDNLATFLALRTQWQKLLWGVTTNVSTTGARLLDEAGF